MISAIKRIQRRLLLFLAASLILTVPLFSGISHAATQSMADMDSPTPGSDCSSYCIRTSGAQLNNGSGTLEREEKNLPDPEPFLDIPYYLQFLKSPVPSKINPTQAFTSYPIRPPDILRLTSNIRF